jgi:hypothetical protein
MTPAIHAQKSTNAWGAWVADFPYLSQMEIGVPGLTSPPDGGSGFERVGQGQSNRSVPRPIAAADLISGTLRDPASSTREDPTSNALPTAIASNWSRLAFSRIGAPLYARLMNLAKREPGWRGPGSRPLDAASLRAFLEFWKLIRDSAVEPQVVLGPSGQIQAIWRRNSRHSVDLEFAAKGAIYFGLFDGLSIQEGVDTADQLSKVLLNRTSEPLKWR